MKQKTKTEIIEYILEGMGLILIELMNLVTSLINI